MVNLAARGFFLLVILLGVRNHFLRPSFAMLSTKQNLIYSVLHLMMQIHTSIKVRLLREWCFSFLSVIGMMFTQRPIEFWLMRVNTAFMWQQLFQKIVPMSIHNA